MNLKDLFNLKKKCAAVVGGTGKLGKPIVEALSDYGATVFVLSRNTSNSEKIKFKKKKVYFINMDQSKESEVKEAIKKIKKIYKIPDILVNCALNRPMKKFFKDTYLNWDKSMVTNARGLFITCREFGKEMSKNKRGSIINISSIYGIVAPDQKIYSGINLGTEPDYPYNKGGMIMFSKYLASYFSKKNIRVNTIVPGGFYNNQNKKFIRKYCYNVPLNRMAKEKDIKGPIVFLASEASSYITGTILVVDGGYTMI